uniref:Uncharacterized protein n=1 Tax=Octopus bimaculoides TaxID=37653 RepID=A0A0L8HG17_OCTBM
MKLVEKVCFKKSKEINHKSLSIVKEQNMEEKLDKIFDISVRTCKLLVCPCDDNAVKCKKENSEAQHIICTCPPSKKVKLFFKLLTNLTELD